MVGAIGGNSLSILPGFYRKCRYHTVVPQTRIAQLVTDLDPRRRRRLGMRGSRLLRTHPSASDIEIGKEGLAAKDSACGWLQDCLAAWSADLRRILYPSHKPRSKIRIAPAAIVTSHLAVPFHPVSRPKIPMAMKSRDKRNQCHASRRALGRRARAPMSRTRR